MKFLFLVSLFVASISCTFIPPQVWENTKFDRSINLAKSYIKEQLTIEIKNLDTKAHRFYYLALPSYVFEKLGVFSVVDADSIGSEPIILDVEVSDKVTEINGEPLINYLKITLPFGVPPYQVFSLGVSLTIIDSFEAIPAEIDIADEQTLLLKTYKEPLSAYETRKGELNILGVQSGKEVGLKGGEIAIKGEVINNQVHYDFEETDAFKLSTLAFAYSHNYPLIKITTLERGIWVSHWANTLQVEEFYKLTNQAARLKNGFARVDFMLNQKALSKSSHSLNALELRLLDDAEDIYYTDLVGNVSTSRPFNDRLYIKPRYPVFGGWNYNFTIGWTNKLSNYLREATSDEYILQVPILNGPVDATYDELEFSFYLPEGAEILDIYCPIPYDSIKQGNELSYFDLNQGHTKVTLTFTNLVDELGRLEVTIKYKYTFLDFIKKPLDIAKFVFIALISYLLISKIDISLKAKK